MELVCIGLITKPQALKGEFRVKPSLANIKLYKKISKVIVSHTEYDVEKVVLRDVFVIFKLKGIDTCEQAEAFRNVEIFSYMDDSIIPSVDYMDYMVNVNETIIGTIVDVNNYGATDIVSIVGGKNLMLPIIDGLIISVDRDKKILYLNNDIFKQVAVYED